MTRRFQQIAAALIRRDDQILLVQQQGPEDSVSSWALPGGVAEAGELITETLAREVFEEVGIEIERPGPLAYVAQLDCPTEDRQSIAFVFEVERWRGTVRLADPDRLILSAAFLPLAEAIRSLRYASSAGHSGWRTNAGPIHCNNLPFMA